jgi:hypothetical protein
MDLGLAVSGNGLHFREPVADFPIVRGAEAGYYKAHLGSAIPEPPALIQGQGFENIGDKTVFWYGKWPENNSDGVRAATWERDRLGYFKPFQAPRMKSLAEAHFISAPIDLEGASANLLLNIDGISKHAGIEAEILDERFRTLSGFEAKNCIPLKSGGLRQQVSWKNQEIIADPSGPVRIKIGFNGLRPEDVRIYALYLQSVNKGSET